MTPPETRYAKSGDIHIAYQVIGHGELDLVFAPRDGRSRPTTSVSEKCRLRSSLIVGGQYP
jgi:hypothetical protein